MLLNAAFLLQRHRKAGSTPRLCECCPVVRATRSRPPWDGEGWGGGGRARERPTAPTAASSHHIGADWVVTNDTCKEGGCGFFRAFDSSQFLELSTAWRFQFGSETHRMGYRSKAGSETRTMAISLRRSDVLGAQECDRAESQGSRDFRGRFLPQNQRKIEFSLIRWTGPSLRVFTAIFLAYLQVLEVIQAVFPRIYVTCKSHQAVLP